MKNPQSTLPPGFRFHPTDEELIHHYLQKKVTSTPFPVSIIADVDIYKCDPWDLPAKAAFGEKEWYFFSPRDRKYPNGARPNRAAASGYWKATGTDKVIVKTSTMVGGRHETIGVKKALVFYKGRPPKGVKTNWIMHEYRLAEKVTSYSNTNNKPLRPKDSSMRLDNWVLCRIYKKSHGMAPAASSDHDQEEEEEAQFTTQETLLPMSLTSPISNKNSTLMPQKSSSFSNLLDAVDYTFLSNILSDNQFSSSGYESNNNSTLNAASATLESHQPFYNNIGYGNMSSGNNMSYNGSSLFQKLPQLNNSSIPSMENNTKRQISSIDHHEDLLHHPSKKLTNSCSFSNSSSTQNDHMAQYNFLNQPFLNQHLLLSPHLHFQG